MIGVVLSQMTMDLDGIVAPTEAGFRVGLVLGAAVALVAAAVAALIPQPRLTDDRPDG